MLEGCMKKNHLHLITNTQKLVSNWDTRNGPFCSLHLTFTWFQFFRTEPFACEPSVFPQYPPCKERYAKLKYEEHKRFGATCCICFCKFTFVIINFNCSTCVHFSRKSRVNGSVERRTTRKHTSQNPGRRVFTPDVNNKLQPNPKVLILFSSPHQGCLPQTSTVS
jgi:hypothetical protein